MPTMQYDVQAAWTTSSAQLVTGRQRIKQLTYIGNGAVGGLTLYDTASGTATGNILWSTTFHTSNVPCPTNLAGEGILAQNGVYASLTNVNGLTIIYG